MKIKLIILAAALGFFISCEDSFNPFGEYTDKYVLNCILRADSTRQVATISQSYPDINSNGSAVYKWIDNAELTVWQGDSVYVFRDSIAIFEDPDFGAQEIKFYYHPNLKLLPNKALEIEAMLNTGRRLKSTSTSPREISFNNRNSSTVIPPVDTDHFLVAWNTVAEGAVYNVKFRIRYIKRIDDFEEELLIEVPLEFILYNGEEIPVYPEPSTNTTFAFDSEAITKVMASISADDPYKNHYTIYQVPLIEVIAMDDGLSRYYSTSSSSFDDLSVRVNSTDYTNIEGGFGIFGSYIKNDFIIPKILPEYIESFGYNVKYEN